MKMLFPWTLPFFSHFIVKPKLLLAPVFGSFSQPPPFVKPLPGTATVTASVSIGVA